MRSTDVVLLCLYAVLVLGDELIEPPSCLDGSTGFPCGRIGCRLGYQCINGQCCRDTRTDECPFGEIGRPPCPIISKCMPGYECKRGICCRVVVLSCSSSSVGPACSVFKPCPHGYTCKGGQCCAVCPIGRKEGGRCNLTPGEARCPTGDDCINNLCCAPRITIGVCPITIMNRDVLCPFEFPIHRCIVLDDCRIGEKCCAGSCETRRCTIAVRG